MKQNFLYQKVNNWELFFCILAARGPYSVAPSSHTDPHSAWPEEVVATRMHDRLEHLEVDYRIWKTAEFMRSSDSQCPFRTAPNCHAKCRHFFRHYAQKVHVWDVNTQVKLKSRPAIGGLDKPPVLIFISHFVLRQVWVSIPIFNYKKFTSYKTYMKTYTVLSRRPKRFVF